MTELRQSLVDYLRVRRALGFKLEKAGRLLEDFVDFAERTDAQVVTVELALRWATLPTSAHPVWPAQRLGVVRGFARHLHSLDPRNEVPAPDLIPGAFHRRAPYLYSDADVDALMGAARGLPSPLRAATYETLVGLLAVTGMRVGEAMRLDRDDLVWAERLLCVRASKFGKTRHLPLHPSTLDALRSYAQCRDRLCPRPRSATSFFVTTAGTRLGHPVIQPTFRDLVERAGLDWSTAPRRPRAHDLRHTFAVKTLIRWYRSGVDVAAWMPLLSTYLGHAEPARTYWYLSAAPELLALAARRLEPTEAT